MSSNTPDNNNEQRRQRYKWLALINIPIQMGIIIFAFAWLGGWLDEKYPNPNKLYTIILTLAGVFIALYNVIRQVNQINK
ncbi:F0F1-ATPase subunit [Nostoc linckia z15]|nr:F0F1-ATPase subunit [Nostoc linckia z15]